MAPLDVSLKATVSGTATGTINYTFYADRSDSGTNITSGWAAKFDGVTENPKIAELNYLSPGTYTAKVIVERGSAPPAEARVTITVLTPEWSFAIITDLHIGRSLNWPDYGAESPYDYNLITDEAHDGNEGGLNCLTDRLQDVVNWLNSNYQQEKIKFLVILGDISDSAEASEFFRAKKILDNLAIPYIPVVGNHDTWPKTEYFNSPIIKGDVLFEHVFWNSNGDTNLQKIEQLFGESWSRQLNVTDHFQNYSFSYRGLKFIALDYADRNAASIWTCSYSKAYQTNQWLSQNLVGDSAIIFSHFPPVLLQDGFIGGFQYKTKTDFDNTIRISGCETLTFSGHVHAFPIWNQNKTFDVESGKVIITKALMGDDKDFLRLVKVKGTHIPEIEFGDTYSYNSTRERDSDIIDVEQLAPISWEESWIASPVELRAYDSLGRVTGLVNGEFITQIPNSVVYEDGVIIPNSGDNITYEIVGTSEGSYDIKVTRVTENQPSTFVGTDIDVSDGTIHQYTIDWDSLAQGEKGVTIKKDFDGDSVFEEEIYTTPPNIPSSPSPSNGATGVSISAPLGWTGGRP